MTHETLNRCLIIQRLSWNVISLHRDTGNIALWYGVEVHLFWQPVPSKQSISVFIQAPL